MQGPKAPAAVLSRGGNEGVGMSVAKSLGPWALVPEGQG